MSSAVPLADTVSEIHRRIGRNLLLFQEIETALRAALPYFVQEGCVRTAADVRAFQGQARKWTLGQLMKAFEESASVTGSFWTLTPSELVKSRNELVHEFYRLPAVDLLAVDGLAQALAYLESQFQSLQEMHGLVLAISQRILIELLDRKGDLTVEEQDWRRRLAAQSAPNDMEVSWPTDPTKTHWSSTRIVQLLRRAEAETPKLDGMTSLSRGREFLSRQDPDAKPRLYDQKRLNDVLRLSGLFDIEERQTLASGAKTILYRSKAPRVAS